jgi:hypothetical protein
MSSGGDLDGKKLINQVVLLLTKPSLGDEFFVCWDPDLIPTRISEVCSRSAVLFKSIRPYRVPSRWTSTKRRFVPFPREILDGAGR